MTHGMLALNERTLEVFEAKLAEVELLQVGVVRRKGGGVPGNNLVSAKLNIL